MSTIAVLALAIMAQDSSHRHVRASEPRILALIDVGLAHSETFRRLVTTLNDSDVIVYIGLKQTRQALGGYLSHNLVTTGGSRYLRIAVDTQGAEHRLVSLLAHELQHAVEVAQRADVRDAAGLDELFRQLTPRFGCGGATCYETHAAIDVERIVRDELKTRPATARRN